MTTSGMVTDWLLDADPAIRWQVMRDLLDAPEAQWQAERAKVETEGWGADLLSREDPDGQWAGGACFPGDFTRAVFEAEGQPWTATLFSLSQLREFGLDPSSDHAQESVKLVGRNGVWEHDGEPYWDGEVEGCSSTSGRQAEPGRRSGRVGRARSICSRGACIAGSAPATRPWRATSSCSTPTAGTTTCCAPSTTSGPPAS